MTAKADAKTKVCSRCGRRRKLDRFNRNAAHVDGLQSDCRDCKRARGAGYRRDKKATTMRPVAAGKAN